MVSQAAGSVKYAYTPVALAYYRPLNMLLVCAWVGVCLWLWLWLWLYVCVCECAGEAGSHDGATALRYLLCLLALLVQKYEY